MIRTLLIAAVAFFSSDTLSAQPQPRSPSQLEYFQYVFTFLGDTLQPATDLQQRRTMFTERMKLDAADAAILATVIKDYQSSLIVLRQQGIALLQQKTAGAAFDKSDNLLLNSALVIHNGTIAELGDRLLRTLRPEAAQRLRSAIAKKPY